MARRFHKPKLPGCGSRYLLCYRNQSVRQQQRLVEDAGHELRTPLTSLRTNLDVLRRHADLAPEMRAEVVAELDRDTGELAALVEEVVALAADRRSDEVPVRLVLGELVADVAERVRRRTGRVVHVV
ncbi:MAG: histidine kinase dimerization/phospho-acceptor domain-containing protein, partial [Caldilinea sp.]